MDVDFSQNTWVFSTSGLLSPAQRTLALPHDPHFPELQPNLLALCAHPSASVDAFADPGQARAGYRQHDAFCLGAGMDGILSSPSAGAAMGGCRFPKDGWHQQLDLQPADPAEFCSCPLLRLAARSRGFAASSGADSSLPARVPALFQFFQHAAQSQFNADPDLGIDYPACLLCHSKRSIPLLDRAWIDFRRGDADQILLGSNASRHRALSIALREGPANP